MRALKTSIVLVAFGAAGCNGSVERAEPAQPELGAHTVPLLTIERARFRDLNRNGALDPYEDWRNAPEVRARDLVGRMTLEEKAGTMMHSTARDSGGEYDLELIGAAIREAHINSFITRLVASADVLAEHNNALQRLAEDTRLGIPLTISTDPRHHFQETEGASVAGAAFSQWPETLGFAAIDDEASMRRFGEIARQEYRAVGIHMALSPQADLATEPRWPRINGTFGEDAELAGRMVAAYVEGFQGGSDGLRPDGVATVVKHWAGYGAAKDGFDSHNYYGQFASFPDGAFDYHVRPFLPAFEVGVAGVMPTYSILENLVHEGVPVPQVGGGFNRWLVTDLLRERYGFTGLVLSDWRITHDCNEACREGSPPGQQPSFADLSMAWGVEHLPRVDRFALGVEAGLDQFGGTEEPQYLVDAVRAGKLQEARLDGSVYRILLPKFELGLFENPYVDPERARAVVGSEEFTAMALHAQQQALVLLENRERLLPLAMESNKVFLYGVDAEVARSHGYVVVEDVAEADVAIVRTSAPYQTLHPNFAFGAIQHEGALHFKDGQPAYEVIKRASRAVPTIVTVYLDRPAVLTNVRDQAAALIGNFGVSDAALLEAISGRASPRGKLPFELPSSMAAVEAQHPGLPHDSREPLYPIFHGLRYAD